MMDPLVQIAPVEALPQTSLLPEASLLDVLCPIAAGAWLVGAVLFLGWQTVRYVRFRLALMARAVPVARQGRVAIVESDGATGPLAFGIVRRVVAFPPDFAARYDGDDDERELALAHELGHHARGDLIANWIALAVLAVHWFNPVAWIAYRAFRADQEMANDAGVLARLGPGARHAYGCAIVKAAHGRALTPACHLHTIRDLKGRLRMLGRKRASRTRMVAGSAAGMVLAAGALALTASGTQAAEKVRARVEKATGVELARLDPVAALQSVPETVAPSAGHSRKTRVIVAGEGDDRVLEGKAAERYLAANPYPTTAVIDRAGMTLTYRDHAATPPAPPVQPMPSVPAVASVPSAPPVPTIPDVPVVAEKNCGKADGAHSYVVQRRDGERSVTVICTDRIAAAAKVAARAQVNAARTRDHAMAAALAGLRQTRRAMETNRALGDEGRAEALRGIDEAIAEMRAEMRSADWD